MGGLGAGAAIGGRWADRSADPLRLYGVLEALVGAYALLTPLLFAGLLPRVPATGEIASDSAIRFAASALLLLPPTMLMGATLPLLVRFYAGLRADGARGAGLLYAANTLGAVVGTLLAGFVLLPGLGLVWTLVACGIGSAAIGGAALAAGRTSGVPEASPESAVDESPAPRLIRIAVCLTGFAAMICQVAWTRILSLMLGGSVYAFTIVLALFLAGLGLGAWVAAAWGRRLFRSAGLAFFGLSLAAAVAGWLSSLGYSSLPELYHAWYWSWNMKDHFGAVIAAQVAIALLVFGFPALFLGGLFPAAVRAAHRKDGEAGRTVGGLYAWNTAGAIGGAALASFLLVPMMGLQGTLVAAVGLLGAGGLLGAWEGLPRGRRAVAAAGAALVFLGCWVAFPGWDRQLMSSGIFEYARAYGAGERVGLRDSIRTRYELVSYEDGLTATVTVSRDRVRPERDLFVATNGKIDGSSHFDMPTQRLLAHLPLLLHRHPRHVAVIGLGTGCTAGSATLHPEVERVTVVEIERAMVEAARHFRDHNHGVLEHPKTRLQVTDGRRFLRDHPGSFDVVISEPSNPWLAGTSDLFTAEFFERGARALGEGGLFCQWVQLYGLSPENLKMVVRTFASVFPHAYLATPMPGVDVLLLGSKRPLVLDLARAEARVGGSPDLARDLSDPRVGIRNVYDLGARIRLGPAELREFAGSGLLHTDDRPLIAYRAFRDRYRDTGGENMAALDVHARGVAPYLGLLQGEAGDRLLRGLAEAYGKFLPNRPERAECLRRVGGGTR